MITARARLFLCGGVEGMLASAEAFTAAAGGAAGRVALLLMGGPKTRNYVPLYTTPWLEHGLGSFELVAPSAGHLDEAAALEAVSRATAVFVGGGNTAVYRRLYAEGAVGDAIRARCEAGMPYGGLSAGMLIAGRLCPLDPDETGEPEIRIAEGLGLFDGFLCEPHFNTGASSGGSRQPMLQAYLEKSGIPLGYGVDDETCLLLAPGMEPRTIGKNLTVVTLDKSTAAVPPQVDR